MIELGKWSLCQNFSLLIKDKTFESSVDYQVIFNGLEEIAAGFYPFASVFKFTNTSSTDVLDVLFEDTDGNEIDTFSIPAGKTGLISFPPLRNIVVKVKGASGKLHIELHLSKVLEEQNG